MAYRSTLQMVMGC